MQKDMLEVASSQATGSWTTMKLKNMDRNGTYMCYPSYTTFTKTVSIAQNSSNMNFLNESVMSLYKEATSNGTDLLSNFGYFASRYGVNDNFHYKFLICRSNTMETFKDTLTTSLSSLKNQFATAV